MRKFFYRLLIELTNRKTSSLLLSKLSQSKLSKKFIPSFIKLYHINIEEVEKNLHEYHSIQEFFTRTLKAGSRPINKDPHTVISPVDGVIEAFGTIDEESLFYVKNKQYSLADMFANEEEIEKYIGGQYIIIYLSPSNYHRIHSPLDGKIVKKFTLGKRSYPVNRLGLLYGKDPLSKNFRKITIIEHPLGKLALVKIGAMFVNSIEYLHDNERTTKGEELAYFAFGSTVILLFENGTFRFSETVKLKSPVHVGEPIGTIQ
ncbi:phosphatidylserine decarboxylase [Bacillus kwashiorkori]|uniref:phosphatidylserine decarboxylase n=1 Tax=Bacillus kwashiorkori TaxID=1522318 RepID=UPI000785BDB1|nr:phosphatidylserine decarboxylase [Bacillus kwashiorkori]